MKDKIFEEMKARNKEYWSTSSIDDIDDLLEKHLDELEYLLDTNYENGKCRMDLNNWNAYVSMEYIKELMIFMLDFGKSVYWVDFRKRKSNIIIDHLYDELEDDETETGGIAYLGETLGNFLDEHNSACKDKYISLYDSLDKINTILKDCGIKEIRN